MPLASHKPLSDPVSRHFVPPEVVGGVTWSGGRTAHASPRLPELLEHVLTRDAVVLCDSLRIGPFPPLFPYKILPTNTQAPENDDFTIGTDVTLDAFDFCIRVRIWDATDGPQLHIEAGVQLERLQSLCDWPILQNEQPMIMFGVAFTD